MGRILGHPAIGLGAAFFFRRRQAEKLFIVTANAAAQG
jgi:hypothetical protein